VALGVEERATKIVTIHATDRASRLRRFLTRLGYDLVDAEGRGHFYIRRNGSKVNETADLFGLDLTGVEQWIRAQAKLRA
jgi:hypothetical protein